MTQWPNHSLWIVDLPERPATDLYALVFQLFQQSGIPVLRAQFRKTPARWLETKRAINGRVWGYPPLRLARANWKLGNGEPTAHIYWSRSYAFETVATRSVDSPRMFLLHTPGSGGYRYADPIDSSALPATRVTVFPSPTFESVFPTLLGLQLCATR